MFYVGREGLVMRVGVFGGGGVMDVRVSLSVVSRFV